jgi:predicted  nucleic acid-binding Zn-ribbon protein
LRTLLVRNRKRTILGMDPQQVIKYFFGLNASTAVIVLVLIMLFLLREGIDFLPTYRNELVTYRRAGLEFCDIIDKPLKEHQSLSSSLRQSVSGSLETLSKTARDRRDAAFLLRNQAEEKATQQRETLEQALEQVPPPAADKLDILRREQQKAAEVAAASLVYPALFTAAEKKQLQTEFAALTPEVTDLPPLLQTLAADFMAKDREARTKFEALVTAQEEFEEAPEGLQEVLDELKEHAQETKEKADEFHVLETNRQRLLEAAAKAKDAEEKASLTSEAEASVAEEVNLEERTKELTARTGELREQLEIYVKAAEKASASLPQEAGTPSATAMLAEVRDKLPVHVKEMR